MERPSKQHHSRLGMKNREKKQVLKGWVVWDRPQDWYVTYLSAGTRHTSVASLYLRWSFREDCGVPGQFLASLMGYQITLYQQIKWARDCSLALRPVGTTQLMSIWLNSLTLQNRVAVSGSCLGQS